MARNFPICIPASIEVTRSTLKGPSDDPTKKPSGNSIDQIDRIMRSLDSANVNYTRRGVFVRRIVDAPFRNWHSFQGNQLKTSNNQHVDETRRGSGSKRRRRSRMERGRGEGEGGIINEREPRYCRVAERYAMMDRVEIIGASLSFSSLERRIMKHLWKDFCPGTQSTTR